MSRDSPIPGLADSLRWERSERIAAVAPPAVITITLTAAMVMFAWFAVREGNVQWVEITGACAVGAMLAGLLAGWMWRRELPFARAVRDRRGDIVWVFMGQRGQRGSQHWVTVGLVDGRAWSLAVPGQANGARAVQAVAALAPTAAVGFTPERQSVFGRSPESLRGSR
jgi:hypothetical protein